MSVSKFFFYFFSLQIANGRAKINLSKPRAPFQKTRLGAPFHLSRDIYEGEGGKRRARVSDDIYAFGMLLWVLCDGTGNTRPKAYDDYEEKAEMEIAVHEGILPECPLECSSTCWELMNNCWEQCSGIQMDFVIEKLKNV